MDINPLQLLQVLALGHEPPQTNDFYAACDQATYLITDILTRKAIDVTVEGPPEFTDQDPLWVLYDFVHAYQLSIAAASGACELDDSLGLAQVAVHNFVTRVMPHCTYQFRPRFTRPRQDRLLPARGSWGKHVVKSTVLLPSQESYTHFKELPPS